MNSFPMPPVALATPPKRPKSQMQKVIEEIVAFNGLSQAFEEAADLSRSFHLKLEQEGYMPFVIERHGERICVCHYFLQEGDVMYDPEIVYRASDWLPTEITQLAFMMNGQELGGYQRIFSEDGKQYRPKLLKDVQELSEQWAKNLREQGFTKVKGRSSTHHS